VPAAVTIPKKNDGQLNSIQVISPQQLQATKESHCDNGAAASAGCHVGEIFHVHGDIDFHKDGVFPSAIRRLYLV